MFGNPISLLCLAVQASILVEPVKQWGHDSIQCLCKHWCPSWLCQNIWVLLSLSQHLSPTAVKQQSMEMGNGFCTASCTISLPAQLDLIVSIKGRRGIAKCRMQSLTCWSHKVCGDGNEICNFIGLQNNTTEKKESQQP